MKILDGVGKATSDPNAETLKTYTDFLNTEGKIRFQWYVDQDSKSIKWCDLIGPEKIGHFSIILTLFPALEKKHEL